jgi:hypothetical protein
MTPSVSNRRLVGIGQGIGQQIFHIHFIKTILGAAELTIDLDPVSLRQYGLQFCSAQRIQGIGNFILRTIAFKFD